MNGYLMVFDLKFDFVFRVFWIDYLILWIFLELGDKKLDGLV